MRLNLEPYLGQRLIYTATFIKYGRAILVERGQPRPRRGTALLRGVQFFEGELVADHLWIAETAELITLGVRRMDRLRFFAVAHPYIKGVFSLSRENEEDYKLTEITEVSILDRVEVKPMP